MDVSAELNSLVSEGKVWDPAFRANNLHACIYRVLLELDDPPALPARMRAYYRLRPFVPLALRHAMQRGSGRREVADDWYLPHALIDAYEQAGLSLDPIRRSPPWPDGKRTSLVLTHDVETAEGLAAIDRVARLEEKLGLRSSWNFVADRYSVDGALLDDLRARGFEVGVHGAYHDGRLYSSHAEFDRRVPVINDALHRWGAVGFRSPQLHRNLAWLQALDISYDSSCFDVDPFQPMAGGCASLWPFQVGRFIEIPCTMPQDHTLFVVLGQSNGRIWEKKAEWLSGWGGMVCMLTHPDYLTHPPVWDAYTHFLSWLSDRGDSWNVLPRDLAARTMALESEGGIDISALDTGRGSNDTPGLNEPTQQDTTP